jgi:hypothetical protein
MRRLSLTIVVLIVVWSVSMSFFALSAYEDDWTWALVGAGALIVFVALGGLLVPAARKGVAASDRKAATWLMQFFGALVTTELLIAALVAWVMGNRTHSSSNAYQVLGLLIILFLLGAGQGIVATFVFVLANRKAPPNRGTTTGHGPPALTH